MLKRAIVKITQVIIVLIILVGLLGGAAGCSDRKENITEPGSPVVIESSFPDGAPQLDHTAELVYTIKIFAHDIKDMDFTINLPDAFQLISGDISWSGDLNEGTVKEISVLIKAVQTGNYEIKVTTYVNPEQNGGYGGNGHHSTYVAVSDDSAEWGAFPPWRPKNSNPVRVAPSKPLPQQ